jgi:hypothetical protein
MRRSILALAALTLVALTRPIAAGDKRTSALAVRVTVVRSCSVNTEGSLLPAGMVTCGSRFGPPVMSASSTITMPASAPPAARIDATPIAPVSSIQAVEAAARSAETTAVEASSLEWISAGDAAPPAAPAGPREASSADDGSARAATMSFRVVTVNF